jgi:hypothetical protein
MPNLSKQRLELVCRQAPRQGATQARKVTGLDRIPRHETPLHQKVKKVFEGMQPPIDCRRCEALLVLVFKEALHVPKRHRLQGLRDGGKEEPQIEGITLDGMPGVLPPLQIGLKLV